MAAAAAAAKSDEEMSLVVAERDDLSQRLQSVERRVEVGGCLYPVCTAVHEKNAVYHTEGLLLATVEIVLRICHDCFSFFWSAEGTV